MLKKLPTHDWSVLDDHWLPRFWVSVWRAEDAASFSSGMRLRYLRDIDILYDHLTAQQCDVSFDDALAQCDLSTLEGHLEGFYFFLRNTAAANRRAADRWLHCLRFVRAITVRIDEESEGASQRLDIDALCSRLDSLRTGLRPHARSHTTSLLQ
jgi:hypothetical protein